MNNKIQCLRLLGVKSPKSKNLLNLQCRFILNRPQVENEHMSLSMRARSTKKLNTAITVQIVFQKLHEIWYSQKLHTTAY